MQTQEALEVPPAAVVTLQSPLSANPIAGKNATQGRNRSNRATMHPTGRPIPETPPDPPPDKVVPRAPGAEGTTHAAIDDATDRQVDLKLLRAAAKGDGEAYATLFERHAQRLFRLAYSLCGNAADAEDLLQETLAGAHQGLERFEGRSSVKTWLSRILVTQAARLRRSRRGKQMLSLHSDADGPAIDAPEAGNVPVDAAVSWRIDLAAALQRLSPEHREVVVLREIEGLSYDQIAEVLRIPGGTVESRLYRARAELRQHLKSYLPE